MAKACRSNLALLGIALLVFETVLPTAQSTESWPSASDVFDNYVRGLGGQDAMDKLHSIERIGMISNEYAQAKFAAGSYHTCIRYPDRIAIEIETASWHVAQALTKDGAIQCDDDFQACKPASADVERQLADTARYANKDLLDEAEKWRHSTLSLSQDGKAWRLTLHGGGRWAEFDRDHRNLRWLGNKVSARRFGNWRWVQNVLIPFRLEDYALENDQRAWRSTVHLSEVRIADEPSSWCTDRFGKD